MNKLIKHFIPISVILLLSGCYGEQASENQSTESSIQEWLTFEGNGKHIILISGDEEYRSEEALPQLAKILSERHGYKCTVLFAQDPEQPGIVDPNYLHNIPGLNQLATADLMIIFTRFRALPDNQMNYIDDYLKSGKPVIGIRTSTHAFHFKEDGIETKFGHYGNYYDGEDEWKGGFGRLILGEKWIAHHGNHGNQSTRGIVAEGADNHPILNGIGEGEIWGPTDVYKVRLPLRESAQPIVLGQTIDRELEMDENDPRLGLRPTDKALPDLVKRKNAEGVEMDVDQNDPMIPIAWSNSYQIPGGKQGKSFGTTIGASVDLLEEGTRRMMINAVFWCLGDEVPEKANVDIVGAYNPTRFAFREDGYWDEKKLVISEMK